jgi:hypothetical protein
MSTAQRLWSTFPFLIALAVLIFLIWSAVLALGYPYDGVIWYDSYGSIQEIDPLGENQDLLRVGDKIISINGVLWIEARPLYPGLSAGDSALLLIQREESKIPITISLVNPPFEEYMTRLAPLLVALIFWLVAVGVQAFKPAYEPATLLFLFFQATAALLIAGATSLWGPAWTSNLLNILFRRK